MAAAYLRRPRAWLGKMDAQPDEQLFSEKLENKDGRKMILLVKKEKKRNRASQGSEPYRVPNPDVIFFGDQHASLVFFV